MCLIAVFEWATDRGNVYEQRRLWVKRSWAKKTSDNGTIFGQFNDPITFSSLFARDTACVSGLGILRTGENLL
jgi:hypothetical protein